MFKRENIIQILIIIQPMIDIVTSLSMHFSSISIGALLRTLLMVFLMIYVFSYLFKVRKRAIWLYVMPLATIAFSLVINFFLKPHSYLFAEINFALKTGYYVVIIYTAIILLESKAIQQMLILRASKITGIIIGASYWLAIITNTSTGSYTYEKVGYSGWFYAANELSVAVIILIALTMINLRYERTISAYLSFILMISMAPMVGTKTAFTGGIIIIFFYVAYLLFSWNIKQLKSHVLFLGIVIIFIGLLPFSPMMENTKQMDIQQPVKEIQVQDETLEQQSTITGKILSSRNVYFQQKKEDFIRAKGIRKAFGLGYAGDYLEHPKMIEMDFFDLFFGYGVIGTVILLFPAAILCKRTFFPLRPLRIERVILLLTVCLCFGIALLAGHVLFAPSAMTYIGLLFIALGFNHQKRNGGLYHAK